MEVELNSNAAVTTATIIPTAMGKLVKHHQKQNESAAKRAVCTKPHFRRRDYRDKMPKSVQPQAKRMLHSIWDAPKKEEALKAFDLFLNTFEAKHSAAVVCVFGKIVRYC